MQMGIKLNTRNLHLLPGDVIKPLYDRSHLKPGIVHIGVGGFHRSHQAYYTDRLIGVTGVSDWAVCGVGLLDSDRILYKRLTDQDCLYSLMVIHPDGTFNTRVIGSIIEYLFAPENPAIVIEKLAHPSTKIVSLTITEGGYNFNQSTQVFEIENPDIQWDLKHPHQPRTVFGFLTESLLKRRERGLEAFTILSCDNIQHNGDIARKMLLSFAGIRDPELAEWINANVCFPNCMVDRITPVSTDSVKQTLLQDYGIIDECPVICEPFCQWVIEDSFSNGRPEWEKAGVQFVADVSPFEKMKIRLLNAGHSLLGFTGALYGYTYIHEVVQNNLFAKLLRNFMDNEVTPVLDEVPGIDLGLYKDSLFERFGNSRIRDSVARICLQSSAKIPKFLLPTIRDQLKRDGAVDLSALVIAAWCRYCEGIDEKGSRYTLEDDMKLILPDMALRSREDPLAFLKIEPVFGDLISSQAFTYKYVNALKCIYDSGIAECIKKMC